MAEKRKSSLFSGFTEEDFSMYWENRYKKSFKDRLRLTCSIGNRVSTSPHVEERFIALKFPRSPRGTRI